MAASKLHAFVRVFVVSLLVMMVGTVVAQDSAGSTVRFLIAENFWADWNPYQHTAQSQSRIEGQIFDYLVDFPDTSAAAVPMLATAWTLIDERTWEFTLREGVTFHDGSAFDAEDVKASIERASGATDVQTLQAGNWIRTTVEIVDPYTVRLVTDEPFAALLSQLRSTIIVSSDDLANNAEAIKSQPNGTGPFILVTNDPTRKVMEANPNYWQGAPSIQTLVWEFIQDPDTRLSALLAGQVDAIDRVPPPASRHHRRRLQFRPEFDHRHRERQSVGCARSSADLGGVAGIPSGGHAFD